MPVSVGLGWICPAGFGDSPGRHRTTVSKPPEKSQTYYHKEERSAVQNKELTKANKTTLRFAGHQEPLMQRSGKSHPKSKTSIQHKPLYTRENRLEYKTRKRTEAQQ
jgi:membrane-bound lytic murein transglycosylase